MGFFSEHEKNMIIRTDPDDTRTPEEASDDVITLSDGRIIICTRDAKGRRVVPDEIMNDHYRELPNGTRSEDGRQAYNGGLLTGFEAMDADKKKEVQRMGAEALNAAHAQRRTISETIDAMLRTKASAEDIKALGLQEGATKQEALVAAMYREAVAKGTVKAFDSLRDTVGETPIVRQQIATDMIMTAADRALLEKTLARLGTTGKTQDIVSEGQKPDQSVKAEEPESD